MSLKSYGATHQPIDNGPACQVYLTGAEFGLTAPGTSALVQSGGYRELAVGVTNSVAGSVAVQRYLDAAGTIPQGPAVSASLTAATAGVVNVTDGVPFQSFRVTVTGAGTLSNVALLMQS